MLKNVDLTKWGPITVLLVGIVLAAAIGGLVITIVHPETLSFEQYLDDLKAFALALAALAGAHGLLGAGQKIADAHASTAAANLSGGGDVSGLTQGVRAEGFEPPAKEQT